MTARRYAESAVGAPIGPGSLLWATAGDPRSLLPGSAAGILQLMLPGLGAGVTDHSNFFDDPFDRINRSVPIIWGSIFTDDASEGDARGRGIRDLHPDIKGTDHHGQPYHALDPDVFWWAHATFTWELLRARDLLWPRPLRRREKEQLYAETVTWYRRYGLSDRPVPPTLSAFYERFEEICRTELEVTPAAAWVLDPASSSRTGPAPVRLPGPLSPLDGVATHLAGELLRVFVYGAMPDSVRRRFGFVWSLADRATFTWVCATLRTLEPAVHRGALSALWPEGTPHLEPGSSDRIVVAGPNLRQRRDRTAAAGRVDGGTEPDPQPA